MICVLTGTDLWNNFGLQELVEVVKNSETTVSSLAEEVESRKKQLEECQQQLASKNGD